MAKVDASVRQAEQDLRVTVARNLALARTSVGKLQADWLREYPQYLTTKTKLSNWECALSLPSMLFLIKLCEDYGFSLDFFFRGTTGGVGKGVARVLALLNTQPDAPSDT